MRLPNLQSSHYQFRDAWTISGLALAYALLAKIVLMYFSEAGNITLIWLPGGLGLAALILGGLRLWPGILAGALVAGLLVGDSFWLSLAIAIGNTLESVIACRWLQRNPKFSLSLDAPQCFLQLLLAAVLFAVLSASIGPLALLVSNIITPGVAPSVALHWWMADVFGIATVTPVFLIWRHWPSDWFRGGRRTAESLIFVVLAIQLAQLTFIQASPVWLGQFYTDYWMFAIMCWAAIRFGCHGVSLVTTVSSMFALFGIAKHQGFFAHDFDKSGMMNFWFYMVILSSTGILLGLTFNRNRLITEGLQDSEYRLRALLDASPVPFALCSENQAITLLNPAFLSCFGYRLHDIPTLGDWWLKAYPDPEYRQLIHKQWQKELARCRFSGETFQAIESQIRCRDGESRSVLITTAIVSDSVESNYLIILYDMTDKLASTKALAKSVSMLQATFDATADGIMVVDLQGEISAYNQQLLKLWGLSAAQLSEQDGNDVFSLLMERVNDPGQIVKRFQELAVEPFTETLELLTLRNGMCFEWYSRAQWVDKVVVGRVWSFRDISVRQRIEEQLLWRTAFLEALTESAPDGILAVDNTGKKILQNQLVEQLWRIPPEIACNPDDSVQVEFVKNQTSDPEAFATLISQAYTHPLLVVDDELELKHGVILKRYSKAVYDKNRKYYGRIWHFNDITEQRRAQRELIQKEYYQRALLDNFPFVVWLKDYDSRYLAVNRMFSERRGVDMQSALGKTDFDFFSKEQAEIFRADDKEVIEKRCRKNFEALVESADDSGQIFMEIYKAPLIDDQGAVFGTVGFARDITQRKLAEAQLRLAALVYHNSSEAMVVTDADNKILTVNPAYTHITGFSAEEVLGKVLSVLTTGLHEDGFYQSLWQALNATGSWHGEISDRRKNGELFIQELSINSYIDDEGKLQRRVALFSDITQRKQTEEQIWQQANYDPLTGLPNRRMFRDRLELEIKKANRMRQRFGLLFIDLDRFKEVNDTLGHDMGDLLLKDAARRLSLCVRESDTVARLGGDEFTIILSELDHNDSPERVATDLLDKFNEPFQLGDERVYVSASIGITLYPDDTTNLSQLLKNADQAMYAAKNQGRNRYRFFTAAMQETLQYRAEILADLRCALLDQQFELHYQPIIELSTGAITKAEALLRWKHPRRGSVAPDEFITLAEESGMINDIGDWVFRSVAQQLVEWRQAVHPQLQLSVNTSPLQFLSPQHPSDLEHYLNQLALPGQGMMVEITESVLLQTNKVVIDRLQYFRKIGVQVAINDFGSGFSALAFLKKFDIDYLKLNQSFIAQLEDGSDELTLCEAIVVMAHKLGLKVIAVGVESQRQRDLLAGIGCDYAQGYWFSEPLSVEDFVQRFGR